MNETTTNSNTSIDNSRTSKRKLVVSINFDADSSKPKNQNFDCTMNQTSPIENTNNLNANHEWYIQIYYTIDQMIEFSRSNKYPKKKFMFGNKTKSYNAILNFFDCEIRFYEKPSIKITLIL